MECLEGFIEFQQRAHFPDSGPSFPHAAGVRPAEIGMWMKNRRPWKDVDIADMAGFEQHWWNWWCSLQPDTRNANDAPTIAMDWQKLQKTGRNGFLLVMMSLAWWGKASSRDEGWRKAVAEVGAVLHCIVGGSGAVRGVTTPPRHGPLGSSSTANTVGNGSLKRPHKGGAADGNSKKKKRTVR